MESVLYSISFGQVEQKNRTKYQAFSAAISSQEHVDLVLSYIQRRRSIPQAKSCIVAYRVTSIADDEHGDGNNRYTDQSQMEQ